MKYVIHAQLDTDCAKIFAAKDLVTQYQGKYAIIYETPNVPFHINYGEEQFFDLNDLHDFLEKQHAIL